jgi:hypothetical protein
MEQQVKMTVKKRKTDNMHMYIGLHFLEGSAYSVKVIRGKGY